MTVTAAGGARMTRRWKMTRSGWVVPDRRAMIADWLRQHVTRKTTPNASGRYCEICGGPHHFHVLARLRWAARTARHAKPKSTAARLRLLWHDFVLHGLLNRGGERCQDCGRAYERWHADDDAWEQVMGCPAGLVCAPCFGRRSALIGGH